MRQFQIIEARDGATLMTCLQTSKLGNPELAIREVPSLDDDTFWRRWLQNWQPK